MICNGLSTNTGDDAPISPDTENASDTINESGTVGVDLLKVFMLRGIS